MLRQLHTMLFILMSRTTYSYPMSSRWMVSPSIRACSLTAVSCTIFNMAFDDLLSALLHTNPPSELLARILTVSTWSAPLWKALWKASGSCATLYNTAAICSSLFRTSAGCLLLPNLAPTYEYCDSMTLWQGLRQPAQRKHDLLMYCSRCSDSTQE